MLGFQRKLPSAMRCHFDGPGHNQNIPAGRVAYEVRSGEAQGLYHGPQCYQAALDKYRALKNSINEQTHE